MNPWSILYHLLGHKIILLLEGIVIMCYGKIIKAATKMSPHFVAAVIYMVIY